MLIFDEKIANLNEQIDDLYNEMLYQHHDHNSPESGEGCSKELQVY